MGKLMVLLAELMAEKAGDDEDSSAVVAAMASAAGIEAGTVSQILNVDIACPPLERLEGFAEALGVAVERLVTAAEEDGCEYNMEEFAGGRFMNVADLIKQIVSQNVGDSLESKIHCTFTMMADRLFGLGYLTRDERITLSSAIGESLDRLAMTIDELQLRQRPLEGWHADEMGYMYRTVLDGGLAKGDGGVLTPEFQMQRFIPITKVDVERREVWGVGAEEAPDKADEVMDYAASLPNFLKWSETIKDASGGKSLGNVRAMHGKVAAGKLVHFEPRDASKDIYVGSKIVDDSEWNKVLEGVYTGFSVGGKYGKRWKDPENAKLTRYEAIPVEISLVDNPAMNGTTFEVVKGVGLSEMHEFGEHLLKVSYPWDQCMRDQTERYGSEETARKVCGMIRAKYGKGAESGDLAKQEDLVFDGDLDEILAFIEKELEIAPQRTEEEDEEEGDAGQEETESAPVEEEENEETSSEGEAAPEGEAAFSEAQIVAIKGVILDILTTLGLVEMVDGEARVASFARGAEIRGLRKSLDGAVTEVALAKVSGDLEKALGKINDLVGDIAKIVHAVDEQDTRLDKVTEMAASGGPVLRDLGILDLSQLAGQGESVLKSLLNEVADPQARQLIGQKLAEMEIRSVQAGGGIQARR